MTIFPMRRIRLLAEKTDRKIEKLGVRLLLVGPGVTFMPMYRPSFRRYWSKIMLNEGAY